MSLSIQPVSYWKLDGNSNDSVGSNNGTDTSVTYSAANGLIVQGGGFANASSSKIAVTSTGLPTGASARSINLWVNCTTTTGDGCFGWGSAAATGEDCQILISAGKAYFAGFSQDLNSNQSVNDGAWHMITFTISGAGSAIIYTDTVSRNTGTLTLNTTDQVTRFGCRTDGTQFSTIKIDEVGVWAGVLTTTDIFQLYRGGLGWQYPFYLNTHRSMMGVGA